MIAPCMVPVTAARATCKCCGATAPIAGVVDCHKNCESGRGLRVLDPAGIPVYYHRCESCGFLFTVAFDAFAPEDFARWVYNDEYALVDPDYRDVRPTLNAALVADSFRATPGIRILDYGGGNGALAEGLRRQGFATVDTYDPFVPEHSRRPTERYDLVLSFEVVEHSPDPRGTFADLDSLVAPDGLVLFSTLVQPQGEAATGVDWWYVAPRNGHVSVHTRESILRLVRPHGWIFGSFGDNLHVLFRQVPAFAAHLIPGAA